MLTTLMIAATILAAPSTMPVERMPLLAFGSDTSRGVLVDHTPGGQFRPGAPTVVVIHGINPFPKLVHFTMAERCAEVVGGTYGASVNVLAWDWNAGTVRSFRRAPNDRLAIGQGHALAASLLGCGVDPAGLHLIGHSSGALVAAVAARDLAVPGGPAVGRLTLLDPSSNQHRWIFGAFRAGSAAWRVEHYWAAGPSGFGREAPYPGVRNVRVEGPGGLAGLLWPPRSDHLYTARWYLLGLGGPPGSGVVVRTSGSGPASRR